MDPEDRWRVAIATAPRIPLRRPQRVDDSPVLVIDVDAAEMALAIPPPSPVGEAHESGRETTSLPHHQARAQIRRQGTRTRHHPHHPEE